MRCHKGIRLRSTYLVLQMYTQYDQNGIAMEFFRTYEYVPVAAPLQPYNHTNLHKQVTANVLAPLLSNGGSRLSLITGHEGSEVSALVRELVCRKSVEMSG